METKTCNKCGKKKLLGDFAKNKTKKDGLSGNCKECQKEFTRSHYERNTEYYREKARKRDALIVKWYQDLKSTLKCEQCGESHLACIEFHHKDPSQKELSLSRAVCQSWSVDRMKKEIAKCKVLCSNCHRKLHWDEKH